MFGQGRVKTRSRPSRGDLSAGIVHLGRVAARGASGVRATARPTFASARVKAVPYAARVRRSAAQGWGAAAVALVPLVAAARSRAARVTSGPASRAGKSAGRAKTGKPGNRVQTRVAGKRSKMPGTRRPLLAGLLMGVALAAGVRALKSRGDRSRWETNEQASAGAAGDQYSMPGATESTEDGRPGDTTGALNNGSERAAENASS